MEIKCGDYDSDGKKCIAGICDGINKTIRCCYECNLFETCKAACNVLSEEDTSHETVRNHALCPKSGQAAISRLAVPASILRPGRDQHDATDAAIRDIISGIALLVILSFAGYTLYGMAADIERLQAENRATEARITELVKEIETRTHPATVQKQMFQWIMREE